jgi:hypothetical protein
MKFYLNKNNIRIFILSGTLTFLIGCSWNDHLKFQGIQIDGDLKKFAERLIERGYTEMPAEGDDQMKFKGRFLDKDCTVCLYTTKKSHTPYMVKVDLAEEPHDSVQYSYERIKSHCASILGPGASKYQQFNNSSRFLFNEPKREIHAQNGDYTRYIGRRGSVYLEVKFDYLSVIYLDRKNNEISEAEGGNKINLERGRDY